MKRMFLLLIFLVFIIFLTLIDPSLSFTRGGGYDFERTSPTVQSNLRIDDITQYIEDNNGEAVVKDFENYTKIQVENFILPTASMNVEYYIGNEISESLLSTISFPNIIETKSLKTNTETLIAAKVTYLDLTAYGKKELKKRLSKDSSLTLIKENGEQIIFQYYDYKVLLDNSTLYFYLIE